MKKVLSLAVIIIFVLGVFSIIAVAGGPANKATGDVTRLRVGSVDNMWTLVFNAHEEKDNRSAKGMAIAEQVDGNGFWQAEVSCVKVVDASTAFFGGQVTDGNTTFVGQYVLLKVVDGGEPGIGADQVYSAVATESTFLNFCEDPEGAEIAAEWSVVEGNLQVHYR